MSVCGDWHEVWCGGCCEGDTKWHSGCVCAWPNVCVRDEQGGVSRGMARWGAPQHTKRHNNGVTMRARWHQPCNTPTTAPQPSKSTGVEGHGAPHQLVGCVAAGVVWVLWHEPPGFVCVVGVVVKPPHNTQHHLLAWWWWCTPWWTQCCAKAG